MHAQTIPSVSIRLRHAPAEQPESTMDIVDELRPALGIARALGRGQHLFRVGERCSGIYLVEEGCIKVCTLSQNGDEQIVGFCLPGELVGIEAVSEAHHASTAVALEATRVRPLSVSALQALCLRSPGLTRRMFRLVSRRIAELEGHMLLLGRRTAPERVAGFLTNMEQRTHSRELQLSMSREAIGSYLGIALETVSRLLHQFDAEKMIRVTGRRVSVLNPERLREVAEGAWVN